MIHILTVHWKSPRWILPQLKYISAYINKEYFTYAFCNDIEEKYCAGFDYTNFEDIPSHSIKLNLLADMAIFNSASDDDIIIFIDGDAFPVRPFDHYFDKILTKHELIAIKRLENAGDIQPHPSFCMTTVGFWKRIKGDWNGGFHWKNNKGESVTDVGGNLLEKMIKHKVDWYPLIRTNTYPKHPVWFGIYDNTIYHHGAGFRTAISRTDFPLARKVKRFVPASIYAYIHNRGYIDKLVRSNNHHIARMSDQIYDEILINPKFYKLL